jgi:hypothetical protein
LTSELKRENGDGLGTLYGKGCIRLEPPRFYKEWTTKKYLGKDNRRENN